MEGRSSKDYIKPEDVKASDAKRILAVLNAAVTAEEIADAIEIPGERDIGIKVAQNILNRRKKLGRFTDLNQVDKVPQVGPERFTELVIALGAKRPKARYKRPEVKPLEGEGRIIRPASSGACIEGSTPRSKPAMYIPPLVYPFGVVMAPGTPVYQATRPEKCASGSTPGWGWDNDCANGGDPSGMYSDCYTGGTPSGGGTDCATGTKPYGTDADCFPGTSPDANDCASGATPSGDYECNNGSSPNNEDCSAGATPGGQGSDCETGSSPQQYDGDCQTGTSPTGNGGDCQPGSSPTGSDTECDVGSSK